MNSFLPLLAATVLSSLVGGAGGLYLGVRATERLWRRHGQDRPRCPIKSGGKFYYVVSAADWLEVAGQARAWEGHKEATRGQLRAQDRLPSAPPPVGNRGNGCSGNGISNGGGD